MSKIVFFSIPAYGHTNPTIEVVRELSTRKVMRYGITHLINLKKRLKPLALNLLVVTNTSQRLNPKDEKKNRKRFFSSYTEW